LILDEKETKENEGQNKADEREECIIGQKLSKQRVAVSSRLYAKPVKHGMGSCGMYFRQMKKYSANESLK
jgi:hypothetical protein